MEHDEHRRRDLLPEEEVVGSSDPSKQTEAILEESDERADHRIDSGGTVEHRSSDSSDVP